MRALFTSTDEKEYYAAKIDSLSNYNYDDTTSSIFRIFGYNLPEIKSLNFQFTHTASTNNVLEYQQKIKTFFDNQELFPLAVRYISKNGFYHIERPPFKINLDFKNTKSLSFTNEVSNNISIWCPWTIMQIPSDFLVSLDPSFIRIGYSYKQLENMDDYYAVSIFPNSYANGKICWSRSFSQVSSSGNTINLNDRFDLTYWHSMLLNDYMMGGWNTDLPSRFLSHLLGINFNLFRFDNKVIPEQVLSTDYSLLWRFIKIDEFKDLKDSIFNILINNFSISPRMAKNILQPFSKDYYSNIFIRFFAYMSTLSLDQTLDFYKQVFAYSKIYVSKQEHLCFDDIIINKFSDLFLDKKSDNQQDLYSLLDYHQHLTKIPLIRYLSSNEATCNRDSYKSASNSFYSSVVLLFEGLTEKQYQKVRSADSSNENIFNYFKIFDFNTKDVISFVNNIYNLKTQKVYLKLNVENKTFTLITKEDFQSFLGEVSSNALEFIQEFSLSTKNKKSYSHTINNIKDSLCKNTFIKSIN